jgi:hypothetical protein
MPAAAPVAGGREWLPNAFCDMPGEAGWFRLCKAFSQSDLRHAKS